MKEISARQALLWLIEGNKDYIESRNNHQGDISLEKRMHTHHHGQNPFAVIITCSDSRVIPENIFMKGIGDLFVIRLAGNVIGDFALGSVEYAIEHLGCKLVMVMGHTKCGAINASIEGSHDHYIGMIIEEIKKAIGTVTNPYSATKVNVFNSISKIRKSRIIQEYESKGLEIIGSVYHTISGKVEILN